MPKTDRKLVYEVHDVGAHLPDGHSVHVPSDIHGRHLTRRMPPATVSVHLPPGTAATVTDWGGPDAERVHVRMGNLQLTMSAPVAGALLGALRDVLTDESAF